MWGSVGFVDRAFGWVFFGDRVFVIFGDRGAKKPPKITPVTPPPPRLSDHNVRYGSSVRIIQIIRTSTKTGKITENRINTGFVTRVTVLLRRAMLYGVVLCQQV